MKISVDTGHVIGPVKPMHGINNAPFRECNGSMMRYLTQAGIPFARLHDTGGAFGGSVYVDIENIFRDFDADASDTASYDFAFTDWLLNALHEAGTEPFYRLGATIENNQNLRAYHIFPPKDAQKWAQICDGIIRHYNEGWANGYHMNIRYWEIWNEPDNMPDIKDNPMWKGTMQQYFELYETTAKYLKKRHPQLHIGGYASCGFYSILNDFAAGANSSPRTEYFLEFFENFLQHISSKQHTAPLDFFSWHSYSDMASNVKYAAFARKKLDEYGFTETESILNEWNPGIQNRGELIDAALIAGMMCTMQKTSLDKLIYYDGQICPYGGMWDPVHHTPFKAYYAFQAFNALYTLHTEVESHCKKDALPLCAAAENGRFALLLANTTGQAQKLNLQLEGVKKGTTLQLLAVDKKHSLESDGKLVYTPGVECRLQKDGLLLITGKCKIVKAEV